MYHLADGELGALLVHDGNLRPARQASGENTY